MGEPKMEMGGGHEGKNDAPKHEVIQADEKIINEITSLLSKKGLSSTEIREIITLVREETLESIKAVVMPEKLYQDIYYNADSEWKEIHELARISALPIGRDELAAEIQKRFPDLEIKIASGSDYKYSPIKVRKSEK